MILRNLSMLLIQLLASIPIFAAEPAKPNFLIIVADDLGYSDLGCYGGEIDTPNLDTLAAEGVKYTNFYNTARCWTSRSALVCGYHHTQLGVEPNLKKYPSWIRSFASLLKEAGYKSYHSGKWHVTPLKRAVADGGFDESYLIDDHDRNFNPRIIIENDKRLPPVKDNSDYYSTVDITDKMISYLEKHKNASPDRPFLAYLAYIVPHFPLQAPSKDIDKYRGKYDAGWENIRLKRFARMRELGFPAKWKLSPAEKNNTPPYLKFRDEPERAFGKNEIFDIPEWESLDDSQKKFQAQKMEIHAAMVDRMDAEIGRIITKLKEMDALDNTVIMFFSDNGASAEIMIRGDKHNASAQMGAKGSYLCLGPAWGNASNTPWRKYKVWTHEGGISTPFIVRWGDRIKNKNSINTTPAHLIDITPTLLSLAGIKKDKASANAPLFPGTDLSENIKYGKPVSRKELFFSHEGNKALIAGDWKIVYTATGEKSPKWRLFNLKNDRAEQFDLAEKYPEKLSEMVEIWRARNDEFLKDAK